MRVPTGNFGFQTPQRAPVVSTEPIADAAATLGRVVTNEAIVTRALQSDERIRTAKARAMTALVEDETAVKQTAQEIADRLDRGEIDHTKARAEFDTAVGKIERAKIPDLDASTTEQLDRGMLRTRSEVGFQIDRAADGARRRQGVADYRAGLDALGKQAGIPGADVADINAKGEAFRAAAQAAGIPPDQVDRDLQNFRDSNWVAHAQNRLNLGERDMNALRGLEKDLKAKDGLYSDKLDANKRTALIAAVGNARERLEAKIERAAMKREAGALRTLNEIDRQIASGVPATAQMWANWEAQVAGTPLATEFRDRVDTEQEVQRVLRLPVDEQARFVQEREAALLTGGGDLKQAANVARLKQAVAQNVKTLQTAPLVFQANRDGEDVEPIDPSALLDPAEAGNIASKFRDRAITLGAMRQQYGTAVPNAVLLPQEAAALTQAMERASPRQQVATLASLRKAIGDDALYTGALQQIAPDAPVTAIAGMLAAKQKTLTVESHVFRADDVATSGDVAATVLEGAALLNPSKAAKAADGKPAPKLFLPESKTLQDRFTDAVGDAFAGRPMAADVAFQVVQSYYVGKAAATGRLASNAQDIDPRLVREAVKATLGAVVDYNGVGSVVAPWGMDEGTFRDRAMSAVESALPPTLKGQAGRFGLRNRTESTYYVTQGRNFLTGADGKPVVVSVGGP